MPRPPWNLFGRLVRRLPAGDADQLSDADLLARFARDRDPAAFELLVWRHGGLVLGTCRRILRDEHLAEDAFQATFLVLARKAGSVRGENVAGWLHRVARRVSVRAAKKRAKVATRETGLTREIAVEPPVTDRDWPGILDAEVGRLPERFRQPVILCYLQDYTTEEAARVLGVPRGTILSRLSTARQRLTARLTRRGVTLPATLVTTSVASNQLVSATVRSAAAFALGEATLTSAPTLLATEVIRMTAWKLPAAVAAAMVLTVSVGSGVAWVQGGGGQGTTTPAESAIAQRTNAQQPKETKPAPPLDEDKYKLLVESTMREQIEVYNTYLAERNKELDRLNAKAQEQRKFRQGITLDELPSFQKKMDAVRDGITAIQWEIQRNDLAVVERETRLKTLEEDFRLDDSRNNEEMKVDPASRDGVRLGVMYRKQAELETRIREMTVQLEFPKSTFTADELKVAKRELELLLAEVEKVEKQSRGRETEMMRAKQVREFERKKRDLLSEIQFAKVSIDSKKKQMMEEEQKLSELAKRFITIADFDANMSTFREKIRWLESDIKEAQERRNKLLDSSLSYRVRPPELKLDKIELELGKIMQRLGSLESELKEKNVIPNRKK